MEKLTQPQLERLVNEAIVTGRAAGTACVPPIMRVVGYDPIAEGPCGFAWVNVKPATCQVAKHLVSVGLARKDSYLGGVTVWISNYDQSMARKEAHALAFAKVLTNAGVRAYADSRLD